MKEQELEFNQIRDENNKILNNFTNVLRQGANREENVDNELDAQIGRAHV